MATAPVDHGSLNRVFDNLTVTGGQKFSGVTTTKAHIGSGLTEASFTATAAGVTTVPLSGSAKLGGQVCFYPTNAAAGLLLRTKTCWMTTADDAGTFNVSATGAGAPAGTETFGVIVTINSGG